MTTEKSVLPTVATAISSDKVGTGSSNPMIQQKKQKLKSIAVSETTYLALQRLGYAGESFNDVLVRLIANAQGSKVQQ